MGKGADRLRSNSTGPRALPMSRVENDIIPGNRIGERHQDLTWPGKRVSGMRRRNIVDQKHISF